VSGDQSRVSGPFPTNQQPLEPKEQDNFHPAVKGGNASSLCACCPGAQEERRETLTALLRVHTLETLRLKDG
jgi:hypothetical protein